MIWGWNTDDLLVMAVFLAICAFLVFCVVVGRRRWAYIRQNNEALNRQNARALALSEQATVDRQKLLVTLEEIKTLLQDRKN
ncbi:MAG: hypothetical protein LCH61_13530 [Proteobacteria bacterium]|nr:hypothetical protein [Pseudomonadota bacterium]